MSADDIRILEYVEIDLGVCALRYGETTDAGTCPAELGVDSAIKCFNSKATCAVRESYEPTTTLLRFAKDAAYLPQEIEAIPSIAGIEFAPAIASLGEDLGRRPTLTVKFRDHRDNDTGAGGDPYWDERGYDPYERGTFWGKFRARHTYVRGVPIRWITGKVGMALEDMEARHFIVDRFDGPNRDGVYTLTASDPVKLADGNRALAPAPSNGFLVSAIDADDTSATLAPSGIGDLEYAASGYLCFADEVVAFTRSGDALTLTRAQLGTEASEHDAETRAQIVLRYIGENPAVILNDLLVTYAGVSQSLNPLDDWTEEASTFNNRLYSATIVEPTAVSKLAAEIIEQAAMMTWWDDLARQQRLRILRPINTDARTFTAADIIEGTFNTEEQPGKRISRVWTYFAQQNPVRPVDELDNYRSSALTVDTEAEDNHGGPVIKQIASRWTPPFFRPVAQRMNELQLGRFRDPPRLIKFSVPREWPDSGSVQQPVVLGGGYRVQGWNAQDPTGALESIPVQVTRIRPLPDRYEIEAQEMLFAQLDPEDLLNRVIVIDVNSLNFDLRSVHDAGYPPVTDEDVSNGVNLELIINAGVIVGSNSTAVPSLDIGSWPDDFPINIVWMGLIQGRGGNAGNGSRSSGGNLVHATNGQSGGPAFYTRHPVTIDAASTGFSWGGGGGGGGGGTGVDSSGDFAVIIYAGGGGGGGQGQLGGSGGQGGSSIIGGYVGQPGQPGNSESHGLRGNSNFGSLRGGNGGGAGEAGQNGGGNNRGVGGAPGASLDGHSYITNNSGSMTFLGPAIN